MLVNRRLSFVALVALGLTTTISAPARAAGEGGDAPAAEGAPAAEAPPEAETKRFPEGEEPIRGIHKQKALGAGARFRVVSVPEWLLELFLDHATPMLSLGVGGEFIMHRRPDFDVVLGLEYENISPTNGLYQSKSDDLNAGQFPDYTEFDNFAFLSIDASFVWHTKLSSIVDLRYGAGIGLGLVLGNIYGTKTTCPAGTTLSDLDDPAQCPLLPGAPRKKKDVPPVVPVVNLMIGTRIKATDNIAINVEIGFRDMFFGGLGVEYIF